MFTFCSQFLQPLIKEFSATSLNWDTAHTAVSFVFSSLVLEPEKPECSLDNTHEHSRVRNVIYLSKLQLAMLSILVADCKMNFITDWSQLS